MGLRDYLDIVPVLVAIVSVTIAVLTYRASRKDQNPSLKASVANGFFVFNRSEFGENNLFINISNPGEKAVKINQATITIKGRQIFFSKGLASQQQLPFILAPGESVDFWIGLDTLRSVLRQGGFVGNQKIKAYFTDAVGNVYTSKPFLVEVGK